MAQKSSKLFQQGQNRLNSGQAASESATKLNGEKLRFL
jgi:hypothetical protein